MEGALKGLFGGGEASGDTSAAHDFVQRVTTGDPSQGYTTEEAHAAASHVLQHAPPDTVNRAMQQSLGNLNEDQRSEFAQMLQQRTAQGRPADSSGGPAIQHSGGGSSQGSDGDLGGMLGNLFGGGGAGGMLGGLLGGGNQSQSGSTNQGGGQGGGNILSEIMNNPVGKMVMAGMAAYAMKEVLNR